MVCCSCESDCSLEYVSCINQIAALVYSCTNQIAALEYVSRTKQIAALVYSRTNQITALMSSCTNHSFRELPLMPIMLYNDWVSSKTSLAVSRFQINNRYWNFFFSTLKLLYAQKMCAYRNIAHPQFSWDFVMTFCKFVINRFAIPKNKKGTLWRHSALPVGLWFGFIKVEVGFYSTKLRKTRETPKELCFPWFGLIRWHITWPVYDLKRNTAENLVKAEKFFNSIYSPYPITNLTLSNTI